MFEHLLIFFIDVFGSEITVRLSGADVQSSFSPQQIVHGR